MSRSTTGPARTLKPLHKFTILVEHVVSFPILCILTIVGSSGGAGSGLPTNTLVASVGSPSG